DVPRACRSDPGPLGCPTPSQQLDTRSAPSDRRTSGQQTGRQKLPRKSPSVLFLGRVPTVADLLDAVVFLDPPEHGLANRGSLAVLTLRRRYDLSRRDPVRAHRLDHAKPDVAQIFRFLLRGGVRRGRNATPCRGRSLGRRVVERVLLEVLQTAGTHEVMERV